MDDAALMSGLETLSGLRGYGQSFLQFQGMLGNFLTHTHPRDELHRNERMALGLVDLVDDGDIWGE